MSDIIARNVATILKIIAAPSTPQDRPFDTLRTGFEEPAVIVRILTHPGLPARGPMQGTKYPRERGKFSSNSVQLTVCRAADIVADREKGRLNFLFASWT